jgi:cell wall-associated NlpC family hydrolase
MPSRLDVVRAARKCVGTPFKHQGRIIGVGLDCLGLVLAVLHECNYPGLPEVLRDKRVHRYTTIPRGELYAGLHKYCIRKQPNEALPADILVQWVDNNAQHLMVMTERHTVIHAIEKMPWSAVLEQRLLPSVRRKVINAFELPGILN